MSTKWSRTKLVLLLKVLSFLGRSSSQKRPQSHANRLLGDPAHSVLASPDVPYLNILRFCSHLKTIRIQLHPLWNWQFVRTISTKPWPLLSPPPTPPPYVPILLPQLSPKNPSRSPARDHLPPGLCRQRHLLDSGSAAPSPSNGTGQRPRAGLDIPHRWNLKRNDANKLTCKTERDSETWIMNLWLPVFKVDSRQGLTVQRRELCSILCGSLDGKGVWGRMDTCIYMAESLGCLLETIMT